LHRKALKRGAHFRKLNIAAQHHLRIDLKRLRYTTEFFLPLYAAHAPAKRYLRRIIRLQASLGRARPAAVDAGGDLAGEADGGYEGAEYGRQSDCPRRRLRANPRVLD